MPKVLFAGSFNPYTIGHHSVFENATDIFDVVHIGIAKNPNKPDHNPYIHKWMTNPAFPKFGSSQVKVIEDNMLVDYMNKNQYNVLVRSVRNAIDLVGELDMASWNKKLGDVKTIFIPAEKELEHISSSAVRQIDSLGKSMEDYLVNPIQYARWKAGKPKRVIVLGGIGSGKSSFLSDYKHEFTEFDYCDRQYRELKIIDMDKEVKSNMTKETSDLMKLFFDKTPVHNISSDWDDGCMIDAKAEVESIIKQTFNISRIVIYEVSAFTAYDLEQYYNDSIIVYVSNYDNGKERTIDNLFAMKVSQLQTIPKVIDFVIDKKRGNVDEVVKQIKMTLDI